MFTWLIYFDNFTELLIHLFSSVFFFKYMIHFSRDFLETGLIIQFIYFNVIFFFFRHDSCIYMHLHPHVFSHESIYHVIHVMSDDYLGSRVQFEYVFHI